MSVVSKLTVEEEAMKLFACTGWSASHRKNHHKPITLYLLFKLSQLSEIVLKS